MCRPPGARAVQSAGAGVVRGLAGRRGQDAVGRVVELAGRGDVRLDDAGVVDSSTFFQIRTTLANKRSELYPGTYTLAAGMSYGDAIDALSTAPVKRTIVVTIPEGLGREEVADVVADAGVTGDYLKATEGVKEFAASKYGAPKTVGIPAIPKKYRWPIRKTARGATARNLPPDARKSSSS